MNFILSIRIRFLVRFGGSVAPGKEVEEGSEVKSAKKGLAIFQRHFSPVKISTPPTYLRSTFHNRFYFNTLADTQKSQILPDFSVFKPLEVPNQKLPNRMKSF